MALTLTVPELLSALRMGSTTEETQEATRLLSYATTAIKQFLGAAYADTPSEVVNEAAIRWCGYLFDMPFASRGTAFSSAITNSGAGAILLPYRVHRAGSVAEATTAAQEAIGSTGNPVVNVEVSGSTMTIIFADGSSRTEALPAGMGGGGIDETARDAAQAAQTTAVAAQSDIDEHEVTPHNMDTTARQAAATAQTAANDAQAEIDAHEGTLHNTDQTARDAAAAAQAEIDAHEASTHNHDAGARTAAANAQSAIEDHERTTHNTDTVARNAAATAQAAAEEAAGGRPRVLYEAASVAIGGTTALIAGNVVCPPSGALEFFFEATTGTRRGGVAYARIPAARIRGAVSALTTAYSNDTTDLLLISHGANRGFGVAVQAASNFLLLAAQAPGNFYVRIGHIARG